MADIPLSDDDGLGAPRMEALVLVPHRQVVERGFTAVEDGTPLVVLSISEHHVMATSDAVDRLPGEPADILRASFDIEDESYAGIVQDVLTNEIGAGAGANFVIKRTFVADISGNDLHTAIGLFKRLLQGEVGAYWTFLIHTGDRTLIGATPERHLSLVGGTAVMNPISGTFRYPPAGRDLAGILRFLKDRKETEELYMVLDEELKMMAQVCEKGGHVIGPLLREMARLAHTEYLIEGQTDLDPRVILQRTLLAPTVTGSPLENACRVIAQYEPQGRGYYGGVAALIGREASGARCMDSAILIRTADVHGNRIKVSVGATLVRHSNAMGEVVETHAKAAGVLRALYGRDGEAAPRSAPLDAAATLKISNVLSARNSDVSQFWLIHPDQRHEVKPFLKGLRALVIDAEDNFTAMLRLQLRAIGLEVDLVAHDGRYCLDAYDLVVPGPGPGDPRDRHERRVAHLNGVFNELLSRRIPFLAVCLSHQILCQRLGLRVEPRPTPNQGSQKEIDLFGTRRKVGFYNSFSATCAVDSFDDPVIGAVRVSRDPATGEVHALSGPHFTSMQFHVESVLTQDGLPILTGLLTPLLTSRKTLLS
ncbi:anthranilate synthase family protein [Rhizobium leguminosarum]|uniref:anthranilate synthase family protein n=1 Tax=Rhizobium leguminosarum TaxID=384 RepID=UPI001FD98CC8|nr:anthranilate synthase family protein [Rhizobium leguminosarum]